jgi:hypothetical protein
MQTNPKNLIPFTPQAARPAPGTRFMRVSDVEAEVLAALRKPGRFHRVARHWIAAFATVAVERGRVQH